MFIIELDHILISFMNKCSLLHEKTSMITSYDVESKFLHSKCTMILIIYIKYKWMKSILIIFIIKLIFLDIFTVKIYGKNTENTLNIWASRMNYSYIFQSFNTQFHINIDSSSGIFSLGALTMATKSVRTTI